MQYHAHADPPCTLTQRLAQLNDNLQALGDRLKESIAALVSETIAQTIRDAIRSLLRTSVVTEEPYRRRVLTADPYRPRDCRDREDDPWSESEDERHWSDDDDYFDRRRERTVQRSESPERWSTAMTAAVQAALWHVKQQPRRRPLLTTLAVTLAAGIAAFLAGPIFAAGAGVLASVASLVLTADATKSAAELASG